MGPSRPRNSIRARKAHPRKPSPKPRRKPARKVRLQNVGSDLRTARNRLRVVAAIAYVCVAALKNQSADSDQDVALVLQRHVGDEVDRLQETIGDLGMACTLGRIPTREEREADHNRDAPSTRGALNALIDAIGPYEGLGMTLGEAS